MAWAAERLDQHHAIGEKQSVTRSGRPGAASSDSHPSRATAQSGIVMGIPIDSAGCKVEGVLLGVIVTLMLRAGRPQVATPRRSLKVKPTPADETDRLAQSSRHGSNQLFINVRRHLHTPSPGWGAKEMPADERRHRRKIQNRLG